MDSKTKTVMSAFLNCPFIYLFIFLAPLYGLSELSMVRSLDSPERDSLQSSVESLNFRLRISSQARRKSKTNTAKLLACHSVCSFMPLGGCVNTGLS